MKKRIMVVAEYFPPRLGGDRRIFEIMKRLSQIYEIHFVTLPPSYTLFIRQIDRTDEGPTKYVYENIRGHRIVLPSIILRQWWSKSFILAFILTYIYLIFRVLRETILIKPDFVILNNTSTYTGSIGFICSKVTQRKVVVEYNDLQALYTLELIGNRIKPRFFELLRSLLIINEDFIVKHGWRVTTITNYIKKQAFLRGIRKDIHLIPDGVDTQLFDPRVESEVKIRNKYGLEDDTKLIVYAGRIEKAAGSEIILKTVKLLRNVQKMKFLIVGEGDTSIMDELSKQRDVILAGRLPRASVPDYLASADVILVPFPYTTVSHSISPLKLFEALSMDKPIVATNISGIKEVVAQGANIRLVSDNPCEWASAVMEFAENLDSQEYFKGINRSIVIKEYDWNTLAEKFKIVLQDEV